MENKEKSIKEIVKIAENIAPDICILQMEAWELVRELNQALKGTIKFATAINAMPFLVSPIHPTGNYDNDVKKYLNSDIEKFRKEYVLEHYKEAHEVFKSLNIIAVNKTVAYLLKSYFNNLRLWQYIPLTNIIKNKIAKREQRLKHDFVYMARIESGKGVEYLERILSLISKIMGRSVSIVVLGRMDDQKSKHALASLINNQSRGDYLVEYKGWVDNNVKNEILPNSGVFLYPSHYDNFPAVVNEALAYGLPVVTWDVPFSQVNYGDVNSVKIVKLLDYLEFAKVAVESYENRDRHIKESLNFIRSAANPKEMIESDINIYREIIEN
ncbi:glycosyltransferase [Patescibacteria group bacterium]|nr:glycosyltransferase [Patescibacteria group bacterium]